ncbi:MAG: hypothetical protein CMP29_02545 [Roseibacillus sp.]|nr:hypothetical protein [Roseibacillus sp.]
MRFPAVFLCLLAAGSALAQHDGWTTTPVPQEGGWKGASGFGWYRAYVKIPREWQGSRLLLIVDTISDVDEAFFNGAKVGANGSMPPLFGKPSSNIRRPFVIEPDQIRFGKANLIAWRVFNKEGKGGILKGPIHLTRINDAIDLTGQWLFRRGDVPSWAHWGKNPEAETASYLRLAGAEHAGHRGVIPADKEWRRQLLSAVSQHFDGNKNPYARADDKGQPSSPERALDLFETGAGLTVETVLSEPEVRQPLFMDFDERGRLWVVQYIQYPNPAGLKVLTWDKHLRKVFDQVPPPPPFTSSAHQKFAGRDKITIHEDTNGDGKYDLHKTFLDRLNMVTSLTHGNNGVWVLHPPYLLFYPDSNQDDIPDSEPIVHLSGFNLEDTHSLSNSLKFGPDGWLYGCTGSTVTARVRVHLDETAPRYPFLGQNIWRYHPTRHEFELFAEGGWNNFGVDFDAVGRLYSGTNGTQQAVHFVQGGYYQKGFGKHGPHTNPYSFGHFFGMPIKGERIRLVHQWIHYSSGEIPQLEGRLVGPNSLGNKIHALRMEPRGSTFTTTEEKNPLRTNDQWFRPVHCAVGPDGSIYVADFYDARITHVDPRDNWDRSNGRIHRIRTRASKTSKPPDLGELSSAQLVDKLLEKNQWARRHARRLLRTRSAEPSLHELGRIVKEYNPDTDRSEQQALEALWILQGTFLPKTNPSEMKEILLAALGSSSPDLQRWAIRIAADQQTPLGPALVEIASASKHAEVISQLASAARILGDRSLIEALARRSEFSTDPFIPLQLWWALESLISHHPVQARELLSYSGFWDTPLFESVLSERVGRRYMAERSPESLKMCAQLLTRAKGSKHLETLIRGMVRALEGTSLDPVPPELDAALAYLWKNEDVSGEVIQLSLRLRSPQALAAARPLLKAPSTPLSQRLDLIKALGELADAPSEEIFLALVRNEKMEPAIRLAALTGLRRYSGKDIPSTLLSLYPRLQGDLRQVSQSLLASRPAWAHQLLLAVKDGIIDKASISQANILLMNHYEDSEIQNLLTQHLRSSPRSNKHKAERITEIKALLSAERPIGNPSDGYTVFAQQCAACHKFRDQGRDIGPDLTGYEMKNLDYLVPAIIDPNLGIREGFELSTITLRPAGNATSAILTGFITDANDLTVTIKDLSGIRTVIARKDLSQLTRAPVSVMPDGLLDQLTDQQIRDLVAYLQSKS